MTMDPNVNKSSQGPGGQNDNQEKVSAAGKLVKQARSALESRITTISDEENVLQQSRFWMKAVTWSPVSYTHLRAHET